MSSQYLATTRKLAFLIHPSRIWAGPEAENKVKVPCEPLEQRILELNQVAFWDGQDAENEFK